MKGTRPVRYAYAITAAMILSGGTVALITANPVGAQVAQNEGAEIRATPPGGAPMSFSALTDRLAPAVVNISTRQSVRVEANPMGDIFQRFFGRQNPQAPQTPQTREAQSLGSGFIISADGYVVTNNHVVAPGNRNATVEEITVTMPDRTEYEARLVGRDVPSDLAVLKITPKRPLPFVKFGDSTRARVGDWVIAIGNPFGLGGTVTAGIISAVTRTVGSGSAYDRYLQTDASINSGNSGGPMFDLNGQVIGINNAIISPNGGSVGIGFAIPAELAKPVVDKLIAGRAIERGYLGVQIRPLDDDLAASLGIGKNEGEFIAGVEPGQAAAAAGIQAGDVVLRVDGKPVTPDNTLSYIVANTPVGKRVPIDLIRDGRRRTVTATVAKRPSEEELSADFGAEPQEDFSDQDSGDASAAQGDLLGVEVLALNATIRRQIGVEDSVQGVVIAAVDPNSDAARKGLRRGDVILTLDGSAVTTPGALDAAVAAAQRANKEAVLLRVQRRGQRPAFVPIRLRSR